LDGLAVQEKLDELNVLVVPEVEAAEVIVSALWVQPVVAIAGKLAEAVPEAASVTAALRTVEAVSYTHLTLPTKLL
jgi:hypothetical protein